MEEALDFWHALGGDLSRHIPLDKENPVGYFARKIAHILNHIGIESVNEKVRKLIIGQEVYLMKQAICDSRKTPVKYELLARFNENGKVISPEVFIPAVYTTKYRIAFDCMILQKAFHAISEGCAFGIYSININPSTFERNEGKVFFKQLDLLEQKYPDVRPDQIVFEILEIETIVNYGVFNTILKKLRERWYKIAVDDFHPVGNHNLFCVDHLSEIDIVKFDGVYMGELYHTFEQEDRQYLVIKEFKETLDAIFAKHPEIRIVVEKIEDEKMFDFFRDLDPRIHLFQWYHFDRGTLL